MQNRLKQNNSKQTPAFLNGGEISFIQYLYPEFSEDWLSIQFARPAHIMQYTSLVHGLLLDNMLNGSS